MCFVTKLTLRFSTHTACGFNLFRRSYIIDIPEVSVQLPKWQVTLYYSMYEYGETAAHTIHCCQPQGFS